MDEDGGSVTPSGDVTRSRHVPRAVLTTSLPQRGTVPMGEHECLPDRSGPHVKTSRWVWGYFLHCNATMPGRANSIPDAAKPRNPNSSCIPDSSHVASENHRTSAIFCL